RSRGRSRSRRGRRSTSPISPARPRPIARRATISAAVAARLRPATTRPGRRTDARALREAHSTEKQAGGRMGRNLVETLLGAVVLVVAGLFLAFAYSVTNVRTNGGYELTAKFERIDGLVVGADVRISGIRVGSVTDARLEPDTFLAVVRLTVNPNVRLPVD